MSQDAISRWQWYSSLQLKLHAVTIMLSTFYCIFFFWLFMAEHKKNNQISFIRWNICLHFSNITVFSYESRALTTYLVLRGGGGRERKMEQEAWKEGGGEVNSWSRQIRRKRFLWILCKFSAVQSVVSMLFAHHQRSKYSWQRSITSSCYQLNKFGASNYSEVIKKK